MHLFDTHCHLDVAAFDADRDQVLSDCRQSGIQHILVPAIERKTWSSLANLCTDNAMLHLALGLHPVFMAKHSPDDVAALKQAVQRYQPIAIGEIGLDFYIDNPDKPAQLELCEAQLEVAVEHDLPVVLHVRKAHEDMLGLLKRINVKGGFVHAFNGSLQQAQRYRDQGFCFGFGGTLTYENAHKIHRLARELPLEAIVLETDAPDMVVTQHQGERNSPAYLPLCLQALSELRQQDATLLAEQTTRNAFTVLGMESA